MKTRSDQTRLDLFPTGFPAFSDYPFAELGDPAGREAPIRPVTVIGYDGDKYVTVTVEGVTATLKRFYVYKCPVRADTIPFLGADGRPRREWLMAQISRPKMLRLLRRTRSRVRRGAGRAPAARIA